MFKNLFFFIFFMKIMHIQAKSNIDLKKVTQKFISQFKKRLPKSIGLVTTIQHLHNLDNVKETLEEEKIKVIIAGQVLGCDSMKAKEVAKEVDMFLYIGTGKFHPVNVAVQTNKDVVIANPISCNISKVLKQDKDDLVMRRSAGLTRFISSDTIGILVTTKPGQNKLEQALELKKNIEKKGKKAFIFISDTIDLNQCENFPYIEAWVNTACPRMIEDKKGLIDYEMVKKNI